MERLERGRALDRSVTELADGGLALAEIVLEARDGIAPAYEELVRGQAALQAVHLLRWAWTLLFAGGEIPAKALGRVACEFVLLFWYAELLPDRSKRWLEARRGAPAFSKLWSEVKERAVTEDPELALVPVLYQGLSRASHFDPLVFAFTFRWRNGSADFFPAEPPLDLAGLHRGAEMLLPLTALALGTLARWIGSDDRMWWHNEVRAFRDEVDAWEMPEPGARPGS